MIESQSTKYPTSNLTIIDSIYTVKSGNELTTIPYGSSYSQPDDYAVFLKNDALIFHVLALE